MAKLEEVRVPDIGDFSDVEVIEVLVKPGDQVAAEQSLLTLESDKASMEIPAPRAGRVAELRLAVGDRVPHRRPPPLSRRHPPPPERPRRSGCPTSATSAMSR